MKILKFKPLYHFFYSIKKLTTFLQSKIKSKILFSISSPILFLSSIFWLTLDNFYIWDDFEWLLYSQNSLDSQNVFFYKRANFTPLFDTLYLYLYKLLGVYNPSSWFLIPASWHCINALLLYKILRLDFPRLSPLHFLTPSIFLFFGILHQNLLWSISNDKHLMSSSFLFSSLFFYLNSFFKSTPPKKILQLLPSFAFFALALLTSESAALILPFILLDTLFLRIHQIKKQKYLFFAFYSIALALLLTYLALKPNSQNSIALNHFFQTPFSNLFLNLYNSFFSLSIPVFTSLPLGFKIFFSLAFLSSILFLSLKKYYHRILWLSLSSISISLLFFFVSFSFYGVVDAPKLEERYLYQSSFFFMIFLFPLFDFFYSFLNLKKLSTILIAIYFSLQPLGLLLINLSYYQAIGQTYKTMMKLQKHIPKQNFNILGIQSTSAFNPQFTRYWKIYISQSLQKNLPQKYRLNFKD